MRRIIAGILCAALLFALCGCSDNKETGADTSLSIVTTIFPVYDFARAVAGESADVRLLIDPGTEVHSYDPSPSDIAAIYDCDLFIYIGGESEEWVNRVLADVNVNALTLMSAVTLLTEDGADEYDEHIWTSPENAVSMLEAIRDALCAADEENSLAYRTGCEKYAEKIRDVQSEIHDAVAESESKFILVADRFPFKYLAAEFGIDYKGAFGGCATSTDISLKVMTELVQTVNTRGCTAAFYTEMSNREIADALARETGVELYELHSAHNVTSDDFEAGVTYVDIMKRNAEVLRKGMS